MENETNTKYNISKQIIYFLINLKDSILCALFSDSQLKIPHSLFSHYFSVSYNYNFNKIKLKLPSVQVLGITFLNLPMYKIKVNGILDI